MTTTAEVNEFAATPFFQPRGRFMSKDDAGEFDFRRNPLHEQGVKAAYKIKARKTPGTLAVEKHRPLMNKLTAAQRQRLRQRADEFILDL